MSLKNSKGTVYYGLHMYPGVAEYKEHGDAFRVFLNEDTIRAMGPSFAGRPVYVMHVDEVPDDKEEMRREADGYVIESFFNEADGKHWVKFIVVSEKGEKAVRDGYRLSNCYVPNAFDRGGEWNGVSYQKEVKGGEYEHLAIVPNPRYAESVILTPDQFKEYNELKRIDVEKYANDNEGGREVKLSLFKRSKVENAADIENMVVLLPKSGREVSITALVNEMDGLEVAKKEKQYANEDSFVKVGEKEMSVKELVNAYMDKCNADAPAPADEDVPPPADDGQMENVVDDEDAKGAAEAIVEHEEKEIEEQKKKNAADAEAAAKKEAAKKKAAAVRNAHTRGNHEDYSQKVFDPTGGVERGKARYGT